MERLFEERGGWTREDLDGLFGPHPDYASAPTRKQFETEIDAMTAETETPIVEDPWAAFDSLVIEEEGFDRYGEDELRCPWTELSDGEIEAAVRRICQASKSDREIQDRLRDELGYPLRGRRHRFDERWTEPHDHGRASRPPRQHDQHLNPTPFLKEEPCTRYRSKTSSSGSRSWES